MQNTTLVKSFKAESAVEGNRIVTFGTADNTVVKGSGVSDALFGVTHNLDAAAGDMADVIVGGIADVKAGGAITKGAYVTTDANGQAIAVSAGTDRTIGMAVTGAVAGDLVPVLISIA